MLGTDTVKIKIAAPPQKGKANIELVKFLAKGAGVPAKNVSIISGTTSRLKIIEISPNV